MEDNDQLMNKLLEAFEKTRQIEPKSWNLNNFFITIGILLLVFLFTIICFLLNNAENLCIKAMSSQGDYKWVEYDPSFRFLICCIILVISFGCIGIFFIIYKSYLSKKFKFDKEQENIINEREKYLLQSIIDIEYQRSKQNKKNIDNNNNNIVEEYEILGKSLYKHLKTTNNEKQ